METDFRKFFEQANAPATDLRSIERPSDQAEAKRTATTVAAKNPDRPSAPDTIDDPTAVSFGYHWPIRILLYCAIAGAFGFVAYTAINGDPDKDLWKILAGCAGVLIGLAGIPGSILVDNRGVHQVYLLGLYEYSIPKNSILSYRVTSLADLRSEGKLWFQWQRRNNDLEDRFENVVCVNSRYGGRYILHGSGHRGHYSFIEELERRGVPAHGYEDWGKFMEERGYPTTDAKG